MENEDDEFFKVGTQVEVTSSISGFRNSWYKATIICPPKSTNITHKKVKNDWFWVEYETLFDPFEPLKNFQDFVDPLLVRPLLPKPSNCGNSFDKFDKVDAYYKDGWFSGVVLDVMNDGLEFLVAFLHPYEEFLFQKEKIRVHYEWLGGRTWTKWFPSERVSVSFCTPNIGETAVASVLESTPVVATTVKLTPSPCKKLKQTTSGDTEGRPSSDRSDAMQFKDASQKFLQPFTSSKGDTHCPGITKALNGQNYSSFLSPNGEGIKKNDDSHSRSLAKGHQVRKVSDVIKPEKVIYDQGDCRTKASVSCSELTSTECPKTFNGTTCFSSQSDNKQNWPFTKISSMWKVIESMEVFKKVPQMPHFSPLNKLDEKSREIHAISMMMKFSYEVERISAGFLDDLDSMQGTLKSLKELESHGFNTTPLQVYVNKLLVKMKEEEELKGKLEEVEGNIRKCQDEKTEIVRKVIELGKQIKTLHKQFLAKKSIKDLKDRQLANLESQKKIMSRKLHNSQLTKELPFEW